ncbi:MAG: 2,3-dihydroxyphenylpropionate 1,2-dioxygenase [Pseudonocardiales bacterium]|jgi:2,3-dihydroxyphenylpropionate 1,2-dioxygenase|nr:2,3-dihydroxyphenylpropionate 1,2-dioxygenase [Pseudonocardiales bacterium]
MADVVGMVAQSHSPLRWAAPPLGAADPGAHFVRAVERSREIVAELGCDAVVIFGPDHFRFAFYDLMPPFCIGTERVDGVGDYGTPSGPLPTEPDLALHVHRYVSANGFDPALSLAMAIDHGISQTYAALFPALDVPLIPIMLNTSAPPLPSPRRSHEFGRAVGRALRAAPTDARVLVVGSGGLSHWPPRLDAFDTDLPAEEREFLLTGRSSVADREAGRQDKVKAMGRADGRVNAQWDERAIELILAGDVDRLADLSENEIDRLAGNGGQEIRTWIAAVAAFTEATGQPISSCRVDSDYEPVPGWITGMGTVTATPPGVAAHASGGR